MFKRQSQGTEPGSDFSSAEFFTYFPGSDAAATGCSSVAQLIPPDHVGAKVTGTPATEKYHLRLTNYAKVPVTVSINGEWIGQWDNSADVPLESVLQGKNQLTVELASEPKSTVTIDIATKRDNNAVTILSLNFQGQTGTHTYTFVAK